MIHKRDETFQLSSFFRSFFQLVGNLEELKRKSYGDEGSSRAKPRSLEEKKVDKEFADIKLGDLNVIATLGVGGFGRVELVQHGKSNGILRASFFNMYMLQPRRPML